MQSNSGASQLSRLGKPFGWRSSNRMEGFLDLIGRCDEYVRFHLMQCLNAIGTIATASKARWLSNALA
jgi:hypothetical protein